MATLSNESLNKLYKKDLISIVLSLKSKLDEANISKTELLDEIRNLNDKLDKLQSDACIMKNVNNLLSSRLVDMERHCWANAQNSRRECLDIVDIRSDRRNSVRECRRNF